MTGTPIQNSLPELYSLLKLVDSNTFGESEPEQFVQKFAKLGQDEKGE